MSFLRTRLLDKGLIQPAGYGRVAFTMPGFEAFVRQQARSLTLNGCRGEKDTRDDAAERAARDAMPAAAAVR